MIVIDASTLVELLLNTRRAVAIAKRIGSAGETLHVPALVDLEATSALRTLENQGQISTSDVTRAVTDLLALPITRYPHEPLLARIWQLRGNVTPYDAAYVALAEYLGAPVITCDAKLAAAPGHRATIELFA